MYRKAFFGAATAIVALLLFFVPVTARETLATPAFWKAEGSSGSVYFLGSIHILPKDVVWRRAEIDAALAKAQQLVFELDLDEARNPAAAMPIMGKYGFLPPDQSLHKMLAPEYREKLDAVAKRYGLQPAILDRMRPWLAGLTLTSLNAIKQKTKPGEPIKPDATLSGDLAGVDVQLWDWAKTAGKERGALETFEDQIHVFADLPEDEQVSFLVVTLRQADEPANVIDKLSAAWRTGDTAKLDALMNGDTKQFPKLHAALFHDRHVKWLPQIEKMLTDGRTHFIVVGAGHLVGDGSVIAMLRAKGVKIEGP